MAIHEMPGEPFRRAAERLWDSEGRALGVTPWLEAILA
jgi:hypothetical protein